MNIQMLASALDNFFEVSGLPCMIFNAKGDALYELERFHEVTKPDYYQYIIMDFTMQKRDREHPLVLVFDPDYFVGIAQLDEDVYLSTAPVGPLEKDRARLMEFCAPAVNPSMLVRYCDFLISLPQFTLRRFCRAFSLIVHLCTGLQIEPNELILSTNGWGNIQMPSESQEIFSNREEMEWHTDVDYENAVSAAIEKGDVELLEARLKSPHLGRIGQMSLNPLNQARYTFISFTTLVTRAAIRGGLAQETVFSLSDVYCQQMDRMFDTGAIETLSYKMAVEYTGRVAQLHSSNTRYSPPVQKCVDHIDKHLHDTIRLSDLADLCGLCTRSISAKFREEVGLPISDYINQEKLKEAQFLLSSSNYSLAEISSILQFNSQSYFTKRFKEIFGMTPQKYRDSVK